MAEFSTPFECIKGYPVTALGDKFEMKIGRLKVCLHFNPPAILIAPLTTVIWVIGLSCLMGPFGPLDFESLNEPVPHSAWVGHFFCAGDLRVWSTILGFLFGKSDNL